MRLRNWFVLADCVEIICPLGEHDHCFSTLAGAHLLPASIVVGLSPLTLALCLKQLLYLAVLPNFALLHLCLDPLRVILVVFAAEEVLQRLVTHDLYRIEVGLHEHWWNPRLEVKGEHDSLLI